MCGVDLDEDAEGDEDGAEDGKNYYCFVEGGDGLPCFHQLLLELVHDAFGFEVLEGLLAHWMIESYMGINNYNILDHE